MTSSAPGPVHAEPGTTPAPVVGLLGLGPMGRPMARVLAEAGWRVVAWNRSPVASVEEELTPASAHSPGLVVVARPSDVGRVAPVVVSMLTDLPPLLPLVLGDETGRGYDDSSHLLADGHLVETLVVMSTCDPQAVVAFAQTLRAHSVDLVDAPVSGGVGGAAAGTLSVMVGADPAVLERVRPVLEPLAGRVTHLGPVGAGSVAKACNQLVVNTTIASLAEAVLLAERAGLEVASVLEALSAGLAASGTLTWKREAFLHNDFRPSGPTRLAVKDLGFATGAARSLGTDLPVGSAALALFSRAADDGLGELDAAGVLELLRRRATTDGTA